MRYLLGLLLSLSIAEAKPVKIAVIDSGIDSRYNSYLPLCPSGHKSFVNSLWSEDDFKHGTNIALTIQNYIGKAPNYCFLIIKVISKNDNKYNYLPDAIEYAVQEKASVINISLSGLESYDEEKMAIQHALNNNIVVFVAAGNDYKDLNKDCSVYPACYKFTKNQKGFGVIGNYKSPGVKHPSSNHGSVVNLWEIGTNITTYDITMTGTSQATAVATGKLVRRYLMQLKPKKDDYEN
jgi:subtilisin family serine protease